MLWNVVGYKINVKDNFENIIDFRRALVILFIWDKAKKPLKTNTLIVENNKKISIWDMIK